jgi:ribosomal protein S18 acetylase RimI-like enzyme
MKFKLVDFSNYQIAIRVQKEIFVQEDGTINILASLDRNLFNKVSGIFYHDDGVKYYLVYSCKQLIGITGLYYQKEISKDDAWMGWFGVLPEFRGQGFGEKILKMTLDLAKKQAYTTFRLYTDLDGNKIAIKLYKKLGFLGEKYTAEKLDYNCHIFSKSLTKTPTIPWNNRTLKLKYQSELDHMNSSKLNEILSEYQQISGRYSSKNTTNPK